jgi:acetyl esterase/lipase
MKVVSRFLTASLALCMLCLAAAAQNVTTNVEYGATSAGGPLLMDVYEPETESGPLRPLVIFVHGGGFTGGARSSVARYVSSYTSAGFIIAAIDYRLAREAPFPAAPTDVLTAVRYFRVNASRWNLDPNRIGLFGTSAGGHLAVFSAVAADTGRFESTVWAGYSSRVQAAVSHFGPMDFVSHPARGGEAVFMGSASAAEISPITYVDTNDPPVFLAHGEQDPVVSIHHSELMYDALQGADIPSQFLRVANAGHGFVATPAGALINPGLTEIEATTIAFFRKHLMNDASGGDATDRTPPVVTNISVREGAAVVKRGKTATINWQAGDDLAVTSQSILLSLDNGETFSITLADNLAPGVNGYEWSVSADLPKAKRAVIEITARDAAGNVGRASSMTFKLK